LLYWYKSKKKNADEMAIEKLALRADALRKKLVPRYSVYLRKASYTSSLRPHALVAKGRADALRKKLVPRYSVYVLYWYKSTNNDAAHPLGRAPRTPRALSCWCMRP
jgi:hypothetical protein